MYYSHANLDMNFVCLATESVIKSTMVPNLHRLQEFAAFVGVYEGMHVAYVTLTHRLRRARTTHTGVCHERQRGRTPEEGSSNGRTGGSEGEADYRRRCRVDGYLHRRRPTRRVT